MTALIFLYTVNSKVLISLNVSSHSVTLWPQFYCSLLGCFGMTNNMVHNCEVKEKLLHFLKLKHRTYNVHT